jgi:tRNA-dihydrouridine synthase
MIGRAAIGNPWIFSRRQRSDIPPDEVHSVILEQLEKMLSFHGQVQGLLRFRKHLKAYLRPYGLRRDEMRTLLTCENVAFLQQNIDRLFNEQIYLLDGSQRKDRQPSPSA